MSGKALSLEHDAYFDAHYQKYRDTIYRIIRGIVLDDGAAQDLTQETFEKAYRWQLSGGVVDSMGAWLRRVAINTAISHWRRQSLARLFPIRLFTGAGPSEFDQADDRALVSHQLGVLSPKLRAVVLLTFYERMTRDEIAHVLGIPPGTVASRLSAALGRMRKALGETDQEPTPARLKGSAS
jgi:RNA polymerase sigma-70 factor (ECF subfamily)